MTKVPQAISSELRAALEWAIAYFRGALAGNDGAFYKYSKDERELTLLSRFLQGDELDLTPPPGYKSYEPHNVLHAALSYYINEKDDAVGWQLWEQYLLEERTCPTCGPVKAGWLGIEYGYDHPKRYDGVSVWVHMPCDSQVDRFTGKALPEDEKVRWQ